MSAIDDGDEGLRKLRADLARRSLAHFVRQAVAAGVVEGCSRLDWGPHLDAICLHTQMQLEAWLVCYGLGTDEMVQRQREAWGRTGATWEDGEPEPWLRYPMVQNQLFNLPPGTMKSTIVMVLACCWMWLHAPRFIFGAASGIDVNVTRDSNMTRAIVRGAWYRETFQIAWSVRDFDPGELPEESVMDIGIRPDADAVSDWATTVGGRRYSRTWQRGFSGLHCDCVFGDDPEDADRVHGEPARIGTQNKWTNAMENRVNDEHRSVRLLMQQVVHIEGLSAYLLSIARWSPSNPKGWGQLCVPAEFGFGPDDAPAETPWGWRDWRTTKGETMHARLSAGVLADRRLKNPAGYEAQYNQNAARVTNGILARRFARFFAFEGEVVTRRRPDGCVQRADMPPVVARRAELDRWTLSVDAAGSLDPDPKGKKSAVGLLVGACRADDRFVVDDRTRILGIEGTYLAIYELIGAWPLERVLVELKALGAGVIAAIELAIRRGWYIHPVTDEQVQLTGPDGERPRCVVEGYSPGRDTKDQRMNAMLPDWQRGAVYLRDGADWLYPDIDAGTRKTMDEGFIGEVCSVPHSRRRDRADALAQFMAYHRDVGDPAADWAALGRLGLVGQQRRR